MSVTNRRFILSHFLIPILLSVVVSFSIDAQAQRPSQACDETSFDLSNVSPGETRTQTSQPVAEKLTASFIKEIETHAAKEFGTQKPCVSNSDQCFGSKGSTRYSISRLRDPFHPITASFGKKIEAKASFDQNIAYPFGVYEITNCQWDYPGQENSCKTTCALIADPSPRS